MREMVIYFNSGNRARVDADRVRFVHDIAADAHEQIMDGKILVNWNNVSFVRRWEEPKEDEE